MNAVCVNCHKAATREGFRITEMPKIAHTMVYSSSCIVCGDFEVTGSMIQLSPTDAERIRRYTTEAPAITEPY